jgi:hypothetical protein
MRIIIRSLLDAASEFHTIWEMSFDDSVQDLNVGHPMTCRLSAARRQTWWMFTAARAMETCLPKGLTLLAHQSRVRIESKRKHNIEVVDKVEISG